MASGLCVFVCILISYSRLAWVVSVRHMQFCYAGHSMAFTASACSCCHHCCCYISSLLQIRVLS